MNSHMEHAGLTPVTLSGSIVRLEPLLPAHAVPLAEVGLDPELWRLQPSMIASLADMETYVASALDDEARGVSLCFVLVSQRTGTVIGTTRFMDIALAHKRLEIGATWVTSAHQRSGANVEAKLLLLTHAFDVVGAQKVVLKTETLNHQSRRAILALGATEEGTLRRHFLADTGRPRDMVHFSVLDDEWPAVRRRLLARLARFE
jgi:N-acetyltransferase